MPLLSIKSGQLYERTVFFCLFQQISLNNNQISFDLNKNNEKSTREESFLRYKKYKGHRKFLYWLMERSVKKSWLFRWQMIFQGIPRFRTRILIFKNISSELELINFLLLKQLKRSSQTKVTILQTNVISLVTSGIQMMVWHCYLKL